MVPPGSIKVSIDTTELRKLGMADEMFGLLVQFVQGVDTTKGDWPRRVQEVVETIFGHRIGTSVHQGSEDT